jgi:hypothetical protein
MPTDTFPDIPIRYSLTHEIEFSGYIADMGDGFEQRVNKNVAWTHADGEGNAGVSYKGRNHFTITLDHLQHINEASPIHSANLLWNFYKDKLGSFEAFFFYNPVENPTKIGTAGKYLMRFLDNKLSRELFILNLFRAGIGLIEVRS